MDQTVPMEEKSSFLKNDRLLVCSMFAFYGLCILGLIGLTIWGLGRRSATLSANATATSRAAATQEARATATAVARRAEQAKYEFTDRFDNNRKGWRMGPEDNEYWSGYAAVRDGAYLWNVKEAKKGFVAWASFSPSDTYHDFDVYVDTKLAKGASGIVCSGIIFRKTYDKSKDQSSYYYYAVCNGSNPIAKISYHSGKDGWDYIDSFPSHLSSQEWKRLEISARGSHFIFSINGNVIYEMDDERQKTGGVALVIGLTEKGTAQIFFDNFGYQPRDAKKSK